MEFLDWYKSLIKIRHLDINYRKTIFRDALPFNHLYQMGKLKTKETLKSQNRMWHVEDKHWPKCFTHLLVLMKSYLLWWDSHIFARVNKRMFRLWRMKEDRVFLHTFCSTEQHPSKGLNTQRNHLRYQGGKIHYLFICTESLT